MSEANQPLDSALVALIKGAIKEAGLELTPLVHIDDPVNWVSIHGMVQLYEDKIPASTIRRHLNLRYENGLMNCGACTRRGKRLLTNRIRFAQWLRDERATA